MSISDSLYEPEPAGPHGEGPMPPQCVDCAKHGFAPSIDPTTGRPPVYRRERLVEEIVTYHRTVVDPASKAVTTVPTEQVVKSRVPFGPWLPAGGGMCRLCWEEKGNAVAAEPASERSVVSALADAMGMDPEELKKKLRAELLGETPTNP